MSLFLIAASSLGSLLVVAWLIAFLRPNAARQSLTGPFWDVARVLVDGALLVAALGGIGFFLFTLAGAAITCASRSWCASGPAGDIWMLPLFLAVPAIGGILYLILRFAVRRG